MKKIILLFIAIVISSVAFSQTAYEKKCAQIFKKYWNLFCPGYPMSNFEMNMIGVYENAKGYLQIGALDYAMKTGKDPEALMKQMEKEYAAARTLMTPSEKANFRVEEERKTNFGKVKWDAVLKFVEWCKKGEFEKTVEHEARLRDSARTVFDEIMYKEIHAFVKSNYWYFNFGNYNADEESLSVIFEDKKNDNRLALSIKCSSDVAKKIRDEQDDDSHLQYDENSLLTDGKDFCPSKFTIISQYGDWTFDNRNIGIQLNEVTVQYDKLRLQDFSSGYAILDKHMKGHIFNYNDAYKKHIERVKAKVDEANVKIAAEISKYDSILAKDKFNVNGYTMDVAYDILFKMYDRHTSSYVSGSHQEPYDTKLIEIDDISDPNDIERELETKMRYPSEAFNKIHQQILQEYDDTYSKNKHLYKSPEEFNSYYFLGATKFATENGNRLAKFKAAEEEKRLKREAEERARQEQLKAEQEWREAKSELERNKKYIAEVNFQKDISNASLSNVLAVATGEQTTDYSDINKFRHKIINWVNDKKSKTYYPDIVDYLICYNPGLNKEYLKNGKGYFSTKVEFYEAFISGNYKDILKSKKR